MANDELDSWLRLRVEDYRSAWGEVLASMSQQQSVLSLGTAAEGVVIAATFTQWHHRAQFALLSLLVVPSLAFFTVALWASESARMSRAVRYVSGVETQIAARFAERGIPPPVQSANWTYLPNPDRTPSLRRMQKIKWRAAGGNTRQMPWTYAGVALALLPLAIGIPLAGLIHSHLPAWTTVVAAVGNMLILLAIVVFMRLALAERTLSDLPPGVTTQAMTGFAALPVRWRERRCSRGVDRR